MVDVAKLSDDTEWWNQLPPYIQRVYRLQDAGVIGIAASYDRVERRYWAKEAAKDTPLTVHSQRRRQHQMVHMLKKAGALQ